MDVISKGQKPIACDSRSKATLAMANKVARTSATVLLCGETGVGKEIIARYIHQCSHQSQGPFVAVNCAAMPESLIEAILFGYEKGAFTGAVNQYIGKFEQAQFGTILLDEISELPLALQAKLLRVLQERELERLGSDKKISLDIRVIAATNQELKELVRQRIFREDLFYRLAVFPIHCYPLRERPNDIMPLGEYFTQYYSYEFKQHAKRFSEAAKEKLLKHDWPGNVRELENVVQRALIISDQLVIDESQIVFEKNDNVFLRQDNNLPLNGAFESALQENEAKLIYDVLISEKGCRKSTANKLNVSPRTLRYKIAKLKALGVDLPKF